MDPRFSYHNYLSDYCSYSTMYPSLCSYNTFGSNFCLYSSLYFDSSSTVPSTLMTCCRMSASASSTLGTCSTMHPICFHYTVCPPLSSQLLHMWSTLLLGLSPLALDVPMVPFQRHSRLCSERTQPATCSKRDRGADPPLSGKPDLEAFRSLRRALVFWIWVISEGDGCL